MNEAIEFALKVINFVVEIFEQLYIYRYRQPVQRETG